MRGCAVCLRRCKPQRTPRWISDKAIDGLCTGSPHFLDTAFDFAQDGDHRTSTLKNAEDAHRIMSYRLGESQVVGSITDPEYPQMDDEL